MSKFLDRVARGESTVRLPLGGAPELTADALFDGPLTARSARSIVLVEDNDDLREMFRAALERSGHRVTEARDGIEGLARILAEKPDVAIVDIGLPGMDGHEVARQVRATLGHSMLLIAMTGHARESDRLQSLFAGFDKHLTKPVDIELVLRVIDGEQVGDAASGRGPAALEGPLEGDLAASGGSQPAGAVVGAALSGGATPFIGEA